MIINDNILLNSEKTVFALRELFINNGYAPYRMSKFEEYDLYSKNKDYLISDNVITFNDVDGKLLALKPDVTLSIIKNSKDDYSKINKIFYSENVYRVSNSTNSFKEIMQTGVECFGNIDDKNVFDVIMLAAKTLCTVNKEFALCICNLDIINNIIDSEDVLLKNKGKIIEAISQKNLCEIENLCKESKNCEILKKLTSLHISPKEITNEFKECKIAGIDRVIDFAQKISNSEFCDNIVFDFSVVSDINYYNGFVFKGFIKSIPNAVLCGGQYDNLMVKLQKSSKAIGFAVYTDELENINTVLSNEDDGYLNIALPKGRLGEKVYNLFEKAGFECPALLETGRKLIFENSEKKVRYFWVKPSDVAIYVERGAADVGVAGKDILLEYEPDVYELLDLDTGKCRMAVAAPRDFCDDSSKTLKVATKFSKIAQKYYQSLGRNIDIIHLNGSIEIAPILGLSDVIVDIVETGATLKENNLDVFETIVPISARLICNKSSYKFKQKSIDKLKNGISKEIYG